MIIPKKHVSRLVELIDLYLEAAENWETKELDDIEVFGDHVEMFRQIRDCAQLAIDGDGTGLMIEVSYANS